jgi:hypothetical protein
MESELVTKREEEYVNSISRSTSQSNMQKLQQQLRLLETNPNLIPNYVNYDY